MAKFNGLEKKIKELENKVINMQREMDLLRLVMSSRNYPPFYKYITPFKMEIDDAST
jgi:hypothetical protein